MFLGATRKDGRDYYVRQFHDMKGSVDTEGMSASTFGNTSLPARCCWHGALAERECLNTADTFTNDTVHDAVAEWSYAYAEKSLDDFHQLRAAAAAATSNSPTILPASGGS